MTDCLSVKSEWWMSSTNYKSKSMTNTAGVHNMFAFATLSRLTSMNMIYNLQVQRSDMLVSPFPHQHLATSTTKTKGQRLRGMRSLAPRNA